MSTNKDNDRPFSKFFSTPMIAHSFIFKVFLLALIFAQKSLAAACCASGGVMPALINNDDKAQLLMTFANSVVVADPSKDTEPIFRSSDHFEVTRNFLLAGSFIFSDRFQAGAGLTLVDHFVNQPNTPAGRSTGLGDTLLDVSYEILPEWSYSEFIPKGLIFIQLNLPTGKSIYESNSNDTADVTGKGFYNLSFGGLFTKTFSHWDLFLAPEVHHAFQRTFNNRGSQTATVITPGNGVSAVFGAGYSPSRLGLRFGFRVQPIYNESKHSSLEAAGQSLSADESGYQTNWDTGIDVAWLMNPDWSLTGSYTDQTILGPAVNTGLNRTVALSLQRHWLR